MRGFADCLKATSRLPDELPAVDHTFTGRDCRAKFQSNENIRCKNLDKSEKTVDCRIIQTFRFRETSFLDF